MSKTVVIYHRADFDGLFCREIARKFLPTADLIGWDYGDPVPDPSVVSAEDQLYMLDISIDGLMGHPNLTWIDHHKSAIEKYPATIRGYRIDGVAACRLAWQWFNRNHHDSIGNLPPLPTKERFVERTVYEPAAVQLAGEYDVWDKRNPDADTFQFGLRSVTLEEHDWNHLLNNAVHPDSLDTWSLCRALLCNGRLLQRYQQEQDKSVVERLAFLVEFEGLKFLALNSARCNSLTFAAIDVPATGHDALLGFRWDGNVWTVSLYHAQHRTDLDLSQIAVKYGGGGHRGACGFRIGNLTGPMTLPFNQ